MWLPLSRGYLESSGLSSLLWKPSWPSDPISALSNLLEDSSPKQLLRIQKNFRLQPRDAASSLIPCLSNLNSAPQPFPDLLLVSSRMPQPGWQCSLRSYTGFHLVAPYVRPQLNSSSTEQLPHITHPLPTRPPLSRGKPLKLEVLVPLKTKNRCHEEKAH